MGMFDYIKNALYCPYCGQKSKRHDYQTKSFDRTMTALNVNHLRGIPYNIYHKCRNCNNWVELLISQHQPIHTTSKGKKQFEREKRQLRKLFGNNVRKQ